MVVLVAVAQPIEAGAQDDPGPQRLRWELVTNGASSVGGGTSAESTIPTLTGSSATLLFRLDIQPLLNYGSTSGQENAKLSRRVVFETGIVSVSRAVTAKPDISSRSPAVEVLERQGAAVTEASAAKPGPALATQRAFTASLELGANRLYRADANGGFMEFGAVARGHFDAFLDDQRFFEKDGITYVTLSSPSGTEDGYFRWELGFRFRVSQPEENDFTMKVGEMMKGGNAGDLLLFEALFQRSDAMEGLLPNSAVNTANRWVMRFRATPVVRPMGMERTKLLLGLEVNNDIKNRGRKNVTVFYGANVDLKGLF
jgi:hypothetical protein